MLIVAAVAFAGGVLAGNGLSSKQARQLIARMNGLALPPEDIHVRRINIGFGGREATVEALVQTGFQFTQKDGQWEVTRVRTGDRRWENVDLVTTAILNEKIKRTSADLRILAQALKMYYQDHRTYPQASNFSALIDTLLSGYLDQIIREDYWHQSYVYTPASNGYQILSLGPDRKQGTTDDIVLENGNLTLPESD